MSGTGKFGPRGESLSALGERWRRSADEARLTNQGLVELNRVRQQAGNTTRVPMNETMARALLRVDDMEIFEPNSLWCTGDEMVHVNLVAKIPGYRQHPLPLRHSGDPRSTDLVDAQQDAERRNVKTYGPNDSLPGPGDPETWGRCLNHPNDPRTPEPDENDEIDPDAQRDEWLDRQQRDKDDYDYRRSVARQDDKEGTR